MIIVYWLISSDAGADYKIPEKTPELKALSEQAKALKTILARVPTEIGDRPKFLALIREVAVAIKVPC